MIDALELDALASARRPTREEIVADALRRLAARHPLRRGAGLDSRKDCGASG
jgi:hypothetical protein